MRLVDAGGCSGHMCHVSSIMPHSLAIWYGMVWYGMYGVEAVVATCVVSPPSCRIPQRYGLVWCGMVWYGVEAAVATCVCCSIMPHSPAAPRWPIVRPSNEN